MANNWNAYGVPRINVVSWPGGEAVSADAVQTRWQLSFFSDVEPSDLQRGLDEQRLNGLVASMSFFVENFGPRSLSMNCICEASMPEPLRLGAASVAWRYIDERVARLWMIGQNPRALYPEFMRQRRQLVEDLTPSKQTTWLWLALIRVEPLLAAVVGRPSKAIQLLRKLAEGENQSKLLAEFNDYLPQLGPSTGSSIRSLSGLPTIDFGTLLRQAVINSIDGIEGGSVDLMAAASERIFDALLVLDQSRGLVTSKGLAAAEDISWFDDCRGLSLSDSNLNSIVERSRVTAQQLIEYCSDRMFW